MTPHQQIATALRSAARVAARVGDLADPLAAEAVAHLLVGILAGTDETNGLLDGYRLHRVSGVVTFVCGRVHDGCAPHLIAVCRDPLELDQDGVTLGEFVLEALRHEAQEHSVPAGREPDYSAVYDGLPEGEEP